MPISFFSSKENYTSAIKTYQVYYDFENGQRHMIGKFSSINEAVHARNRFEINSLTSGYLSGVIKKIAKHHDKTLWRLSYAQTSF